MDHHAILSALRDRDAPRAARAMHDHVQHAGVLLLNHLKAASTAEPAEDGQPARR